MNNAKGKSLIEYVLILIIVVGIVYYFCGWSGNPKYKQVNNNRIEMLV